MSAIEQSAPAEFYDATLRFQVQSRSEAHVTYLCELDAYNGTGRCSCPDFTIRKEPLLARRVTAEQAIEQKLVKIPKTGRISDALRCAHIIDSRDQLATYVIRALAKADKISHGKTTK